MKVLWTAGASRDLDDIYDFIALEHPLAARRIREAIRVRVRLLAMFPKSGRVVMELEEPSVREVIVESYRVVYQLRDVVEVIAVFHSRQPFSPDRVGESVETYA